MFAATRTCSRKHQAACSPSISLGCLSASIASIRQNLVEIGAIPFATRNPPMPVVSSVFAALQSKQEVVVMRQQQSSAIPGLCAEEKG